MASPLAWLSDKTDRRVKAGLERKCPTCHASVGRECGWWRGKPERFTPLKTGVIHMIRIPDGRTPMTEGPDISVTISGAEFTVGKLQEFLDAVRGLDAMPANALIGVHHEYVDKETHYVLTASTAYRVPDREEA